MEINTERQYYTVAEVATILGCVEDVVRRKIERGEIEARRFGRMIRIPRSAVDAGTSTTRPTE